MKKIVILSGKGGTGKTTLAAAFTVLCKKRVVADCDVDAPNLHLILGGEIESKEKFYGAELPSIDMQKCINCGMCEIKCPYGAIKNLGVDPMKCEGCGVCEYLCIPGAISLKEAETGETYVSNIPGGIFSHAKLKIGGEHSGKLVTAVRKNAEARAHNEEVMIIDGLPGIGCAVISSLVGCHLAVVVTEPTESGFHDLQRIIEVARHFRVPVLVCINKYDINPQKSGKISEWCRTQGIAVWGAIPFDESVYTALQNGKSVVEYPESAAGKVIREIWEKVLKEYL